MRPKELIAGPPASDDHDSGRLVYGPDEEVYYTIGDRGNKQDSNACRPNLAQSLLTRKQISNEDRTGYQGKTLLLNIDGSIPKCNPLINGVRSHINTYGHRNAQSLVFGDRGRLYSSEQGPKSHDEINPLEAGGNDGWPQVAGFKDDSACVFGGWSAAPGCGDTIPYDDFVIPGVVPRYDEHEFRAKNFVQPLRSYYTVSSTHDFQGDACEDSGPFFICHPTIAPSDLDYYGYDAIPGVGRLPADDTLEGRQRVSGGSHDKGKQLGESQPPSTSVNRYRDTALSAMTARASTSQQTRTGPCGAKMATPRPRWRTPGAILVFHYIGDDSDPEDDD